jgi:BCD family chlorophyll transporter-like MFS transporter
MMIMGFAITGGVTGQLLDPFSEMRLLWVVSGTAAIALVMSFIAVIGIEKTQHNSTA